MEKIVNGFMVFRKNDLVTIGDVKKPEGDLLVISKEEDGQIKVSVSSISARHTHFSLDLEALQVALEMLSGGDDTLVQISCRECLDHPDMISFLPINPERIFCQKVDKDLKDLPDKKCPLDRSKPRLRDEYLDRLEDGGD